MKYFSSGTNLLTYQILSPTVDKNYDADKEGKNDSNVTHTETLTS